jgi:hypothetical protein
VPVVTLTVRPLPSQDDEHAAATAVAAAIARALDLHPGDVWVGVQHCAVGALGSGVPTDWPIVTVRGRRRSPSAMESARAGAAAAVGTWWGCPADAVWTEWLMP